MENAILGKELNIGTTSSFFHAFTQEGYLNIQ